MFMLWEAACCLACVCLRLALFGRKLSPLPAASPWPPCSAMARAKNTATDEQVKKLLRSNLTGLGDAYKSADMEHVISAYESFLLDFLEVSTRLLAHQVERCAMQSFEKTESAEANMFGCQLSAALSFARTKMKAVTSGAKNHPSVLRVIHALGRLEVTPRAGPLAGRLRRVCDVRRLQLRRCRLAVP